MTEEGRGKKGRGEEGREEEGREEQGREGGPVTPPACSALLAIRAGGVALAPRVF